MAKNLLKAAVNQETLGQVSSSEAGTIFRDFLRGGVRRLLCEVMAAEVRDLCGPKHQPNDSGNVRVSWYRKRFFPELPREQQQLCNSASRL